MVDLVPADRVPDRRADEAADLAAEEDGDEVPDLEDLGGRAPDGRGRVPWGQRGVAAAAVSSPGRVPAGHRSDPGAVVGLRATHLGSRTGRPRRPTMEHPSANGARMSPSPKISGARRSRPPGRRRAGRSPEATAAPSNRPRWMPWVIVGLIVAIFLVLAGRAAVDHGGAGQARLRHVPRPRQAGPRRRASSTTASSGKITGAFNGRLHEVDGTEGVHDAGPARRAARRRHRRCSTSTTSAATTSRARATGLGTLLVYLLPLAARSVGICGGSSRAARRDRWAR